MKREVQFKHEENDCSVRAVANATGKPYAECHSLMKKFGRKDGQAVSARSAAAACMSIGGKSIVTSNTKEPRLQKGSYVVFIQDHCFALVDGQTIDAPRGALYQAPQGVFKFKE